MQHYFIEKEHKTTDYFTFRDEILGKAFVFKSVDNVFSKNKIDDGTRVLLTEVSKHNIFGNLLDIGCGIGTISIVLKTQFPDIVIDASDVNGVAVDLTKQNCKNNNIDINTALKSNLFEYIDKKYNFIVTNPPIKVGKQILFNLVEQSKEHLEIGGQIFLVIRKSHGQESLKRHMENVFGNVEILKRDKGYYVMCSTRK